MRKGLIGLVFLYSIAFGSYGVAAPQYYYDEKLLAADKEYIYSQVQELLNDWDGRSEPLDEVRGLINSFLAEDQFYLPMHIENARYTIMSGYATGDVGAANSKALTIIQWVQKRDSGYSKSYVLAGHVYTNMRRYSEAAESLVLAEKLGSNDPWLDVNWATLLAAQGRYGEAMGYYKRAIYSDGVTDKALVAAISGLAVAQKKSSANQASDYSSVVFEGFDDPLKRVRIAHRLISSYQGKGEVLQVAYGILSRQKQETPGLALVDIEMARLMLASGFRHREGFRTLYTPKSAAAAENLVMPLWGQAEYSAQVFSILFAVAMSEADFDKANMLLSKALSYGVPEADVVYAQSLVEYDRGNYAVVIALYDRLEKLRPLASGDELLATAYQELGDFTKLQEYHLRAVEQAPGVAWVRGNYAIFLMYNMNDSARAIEYGESALKIMNYPAARNITGLAYLVEASRSLSKGDAALARKQYGRAVELDVSDKYIRDYCNQNCGAIRDVRSRFSTSHSNSI